jgi:hypothetical protein
MQTANISDGKLYDKEKRKQLEKYDTNKPIKWDMGISE